MTSTLNSFQRYQNDWNDRSLKTYKISPRITSYRVGNLRINFIRRRKNSARGYHLFHPPPPYKFIPGSKKINKNASYLCKLKYGGTYGKLMLINKMQNPSFCAVTPLQRMQQREKMYILAENPLKKSERNLHTWMSRLGGVRCSVPQFPTTLHIFETFYTRTYTTYVHLPT